MKLQLAASVLLLAVKGSASFVVHSHCSRRRHSATSVDNLSNGQLYQRPRFREEDFAYFEDDEEDDRSPPQPRRQRQRRRSRPSSSNSSRRPRDEFDSPPTDTSEALRNMSRLDDENGTIAPIVRSQNKQTEDAKYLDDDEEDWLDDFDEEDYDFEEYYDEDEDEAESSGNFWVNPEGGLDPYPEGGDRRGRRRASRMAPSTAEPQPDTKRRGRKNRSRNPTEEYGRPPPSRRRPGAVQKTTFRSGTPPPPPLMKNFYDRFFWYGFDPRETTSPTDRTMFGGTKGKFSGLDVIREVDGKPASRRGPHGERRRDSNDYDELWDEDDFFYDDEEEADAIIPTPLLPGLSIEEKRSTRPPPPNSRRRRGREGPNVARSRRSRRRYDDYDDFDDDEEDEFEWGGRRNSRRRNSRRKGKLASNSEWAADEVSTWFTDRDDDDAFRRNGRSRRRPGDDNLLGFVESIFGFDPDDMNSKAREYEERIGRAKSSRGDRRSKPPVRNEVSRRRRAGYTYRYDDDDGSPPVADFDPSGKSLNSSNQDEDSTNVIDVPAEQVSAIQKVPGAQSNQAQRRQRQRKRRSWEDREMEELDRVPPHGAVAFGPEGDVMGGIDARTYAALKASEEIREAKRKVEVREERCIDAEEELLTLKADVGKQKEFMSRSRRGRTQRARDMIRQMNLMVEDAARSLRKARAERDAALDAMEELEDRHWVLLSQVTGDNEFARLNGEAEEEEVANDNDFISDKFEDDIQLDVLDEIEADANNDENTLEIDVEREPAIIANNNQNQTAVVEELDGSKVDDSNNTQKEIQDFVEMKSPNGEKN